LTTKYTLIGAACYITALMHVSINYLNKYFPANIVYAFFLVSVFLYFAPGWKWNRISLMISIFCLDMVLLGYYNYLSHNYFPTKILKIIFASFFFNLTFYYVRSVIDFWRIIKIMLFSYVVIIVGIVVLNLLGIRGGEVYNADVDVSFGGQGVNTAQVIPIFLLILVLFFVLKRKTLSKFSNIILVASFFIGLLVLIASTKRGAMLGVAFGLISYLIMSRKKKRLIFLASFLMLILFFGLTYYSGTIGKMYKARESSFDISNTGGIEKEGRLKELTLTIDDMKGKGFMRAVFGAGMGSEHSIFNTKRMFHVDYFSLLNGAGILGLFLHLFIYYLLYKEQKKYEGLEKYYPFVREIRGIYVSLIIFMLILGLAGSIHNVAYRAYSLLFFGASLGLFRTLLNEQKAIVSNRQIEYNTRKG
jgi:hypothetical protein